MPKMKIFVKVRPRAKKEKMEKISETNFKVWVKEPPAEGRANRAVIRAFAGYLGVSLSKVKIISGFKSKEKVLEIR